MPNSSIVGRIQRLLNLEVLCVFKSAEAQYWRIAIERDEQMLALRRQIDRLQRIESAAHAVVRWDWSDNDEDCVADIDGLRNAVNAA